MLTVRACPPAHGSVGAATRTLEMSGGNGDKDVGVDSTGGPTLSAARNMALLQLARTKYATLVSRPGKATATEASWGGGLPSSTSMLPAVPGVACRYRKVARMVVEAVPDGKATRRGTLRDSFTAWLAAAAHDTGSARTESLKVGDCDHCTRKRSMGNG